MWNPNWLQRIVRAAASRVRLRRRRRRSLYWNSERLETKTLLSAFFVNSVADLSDIAPGDGVAAAIDGSTTLRAAVEEANANSGRDIVVLPPGIFELWQSPVGNAEVGNADVGGPLSITDDLTILGSGSDRTTIDALTVDHAFILSDFTAVRLDSLTILSDAEVEPATGIETVVEFSAAEVVTSRTKEAPDDSDIGSTDQPLVSNIPNYSGPLTTSHPGQADLLRTLYGQPVAGQQRPLDFLPNASPATLAPSTDRLDITLGSNTPALQSLADSPVKPDDDESETQLATSSPDVRTEPQQRRDDVINSLFVEPGNPMIELPMQESAIERVSGAIEQRPSPRPERVPTPEDIQSGRHTTETAVHETPSLLLPGELFEAPLVIPEVLLPDTSPGELTPVIETGSEFAEPAPLLLPAAQETTPFLLPDDLNQSHAVPAESSTVIASLLLLVVRPHQWRRAIRRWRRRI